MNLGLTVLLWTTYILSLYITVYWIIVFSKERFLEKGDRKDTVALKRFPVVSVIIPAYNEEKTITASIDSVLALDYPADKLELVVVDDGSTDTTKKKVEECIRANKGRAIVLISQKNQGKAAAMNNALKQIKGEFFACLDADSFVDKNTLKKMLKVYEEDGKDLAIVTPALKVKDPKTLTQKMQSIEYLVSFFIVRIMSFIDCVYVAPGPFSLYRAEVIKKLGGFDTGSLTEDQEIAYRAQKHYYKIKQCYDGYVFTVAPKSLSGLYKQRNRWIKGSLYTMIKYREIIFNRKYGDFGIMQMSINILAFALSLMGLFFMAIFVLRPIMDMIKNLYLLNFDIMPFIKDLKNIKFYIIDLNFQNGILLWFLLVVTLAIIYIAYKNANEKFRKKDIFVLVPYLFFYYVAISLIIIMVLFEIIIDKRHHWRKKEEKE